MVELSVVERRVIANHFRIRKAVSLGEARYYHYAELIETLEQGYEESKVAVGWRGSG